jgi:branched-chain amino acid transport system substrate-binding protein
MTRKSKYIIGTVLAIALVALAVALFRRESTRAQNTIQFGAILPLSGNDAYWGKNLRNGMDLACDEINERGGVLGKPLRIVYEDSQSNPRVGTAAAEKLISADHVQCIAGDVISTVVLAVAPIVERNRVVLLCFGESDEITTAGDYIFRNWNSASSDAEITGAFAAKKSKRVIVIHQNDAFGISASRLFRAQVVANNAEVVGELSFDKNQTDFKPLLAGIRDKDYDGVYIACYHPQALLFLRQYKELDLRPTFFFGVSSWEERSLIDFAKAAFPGRVAYGYPRPPSESSPAVQHFRKAYERRFGEAPQILCDNGYDAVHMLAVAIERAGAYDGEKVKEELYKLKDYDGASGVMTFDKNGDVHKPFGLKVITGSGAVWED